MRSIMATRPAVVKWRQTEPGLILCAVRWYLRYSLSFRDVEDLLEGTRPENGSYDRVRVQRYAPELEQRLRRYPNIDCKSANAGATLWHRTRLILKDFRGPTKLHDWLAVAPMLLTDWVPQLIWRFRGFAL